MLVIAGRPRLRRAPYLKSTVNEISLQSKVALYFTETDERQRYKPERRKRFWGWNSSHSPNPSGLSLDGEEGLPRKCILFGYQLEMGELGRVNNRGNNNVLIARLLDLLLIEG